MHNDSSIIYSKSMVFIIVSSFVIIPLVIAIIALIAQIASHVSVEEALESNADPAITQALSEQKNIDLDNTVIHEVASDGDWHAVVLLYTSPNNLGDGTLVVLHWQDNNYQVVYIGTGYGESTLTDLGIPNSFAKRITSAGTVPDYGKTIYDSYLNPDYKYPLIKDLPYYSDRAKITYYFEDNLKDPEGTNIPIIKISAMNAFERSNSLNKIRSFGYDLGDYYIKFANFKNPFIEDDTSIEIIIDNVVEGEQAS